MEALETKDTWSDIRALIESGDREALMAWLDAQPAGQMGLLFSRLNSDEVQEIIRLVGPEEAAEILVQISEAQAVDIVEDLPSESAAAIVDEMDSDEQADILGGMDEEDAEAILSLMDPEEASDARKLIGYEWNTAGGIMITEYLAFKEGSTTLDLLEDLRANRNVYADYDVQYLYITNQKGQLKGVLKMRDMLLAKGNVRVGRLMNNKPIKVRADATLIELREIFESNNILGIPVVDNSDKLVGVVRRAAVEEAFVEEATEDFLMMSGLSGEEELRSMPFIERTQRRLSWLVVGLLLTVLASSVIAAFEHIVKEVIFLAAILPVVANLSGACGNQAVAVSIRELSLGLVKPWEVMRVILQELGVGLVIGSCLGIILGTVVGLWQQNWILGFVVGGAMAMNSALSVVFGGSIPLILKWIKKDPALASGPLVMTLADACGFFITLGLVSVTLSYLS